MVIMLKFYISTVVIWFAIIIGLVFIFSEKFVENGWFKDSELNLNFNSLCGCFLIALVPVIRLIFAIGAVIMGIDKASKWGF